MRSGSRALTGRRIATVLGVAWGTFAVVALLSFGAGLEERMRTRAEGLGRGIAILWSGETARSWRGVPEGRSIDLVAGDVAALAAEVEGIGEVSPESLRREVIARGEFVYRAQIAGVEPAYGRLRSMRPQPGGRFLSARDVDEARPVAFLGDRIADELFPAGGAIGQRVVLAGAPFTVIGVLEPKAQDSDYDGTDDERVCIPSTTFERRFGREGLDNLVLSAADPNGMDEVMAGATAVLARRHRFDPQDESALRWWDTTENARVTGFIFLAMDVLTGGAGVLTLLVGGLGIANLMFLAVRRRTPEIGLLLALGARGRRVVLGVLAEALAWTAAGGLLGLGCALGLGAAIGASPLAEDLGTPRVSAWLAGGTVLLLGGVGLAAGWAPARRAAALDPVQALAEG